VLAQTGIGNRDNIGSDLVSKSGLGYDLSDLIEFKGDSLLKSGSVDDRLRRTNQKEKLLKTIETIE